MSPRTALQNEQIKEQRKKTILDAALTVFAQRGYAASTIDLIAKEAGTSKGLVYNYFSSKQDLLQGIFENLMEETGEMWQQDDAMPAKARLKFMLDATFDFLKNQQQVVKLMTQLALQEDAVGELRSMIDGAQMTKLMVMEPLFTEMGYANPKLETYLLGALLDGIGLGHSALKQDYPFEELKYSIYKKYDLL